VVQLSDWVPQFVTVKLAWCPVVFSEAVTEPLLTERHEITPVTLYQPLSLVPEIWS
jgi:hypothetical protein